ncbi:MAG: proline racemase family protein [Synergistaceae bacterium]|jgi:proline racemase|nr:proline racemase family protein [Synergistaceae bacterium]
MNVRHVIAIDSHAGGEPARIIVGPLLWRKCENMVQKKEYFEETYAALRRSLIFEPRGHDNMFGAVICEACDESADLGIFFLESNECLNMCGHGTIATVTALIELGVIDAGGTTEKTVRLDTPAGLVEARAVIKDGRAASVSFKNVHSFVFHRGCRAELPGFGEFCFDVSFGGNVFAQLPIGQFGLGVDLKNSKQLARMGTEIRNIVNKAVSVKHPAKPISYIDHVTFYDYDEETRHLKHCVVMGREQIDRSPCGTGTSAFIALLSAKGLLEAGGAITSESIIGTRFQGRLLEKTRYFGYEAVIPEVSGTGYVTGIQQFLIDSGDPFREGFSLNGA